MRLDFNAENGCFILYVARGEADVTAIRREHGLDLFGGAGPPYKLYTREPYAADFWFDIGTPAAQAQLADIHARVGASWACSSSRHFDLPPDKELWPYQTGSVGYALDRGGRAALCDEPGLGKTPEAIVFANTVGAQTVLVVCPASIRLQWADRVRQWSTILRDGRRGGRIAPILSANRGVPPPGWMNWTIISYDLLRNPVILGELMKCKFDLLIADEAHYVKSPGAGRSQALTGLLSRAASVLMLTGTPLPNRPAEGYTIARALCFDAIDWMSEPRFKQRFNTKAVETTPDGRIYGEEYAGRFAELQARFRANFMVRHLKRDVSDQTDFPVYDLIRVSETGAVKAALAAERLLDIDPARVLSDQIKERPELLGAIATVRRMMGEAIAPQVVDYVNMLMQGGEHKLVLFAWHTQVLNILEAGLGKWGFLRVDGSTSAARKDERVKRFISDPTVEIIGGNVLSLGTGTDGLQHVSCHALIAEPDWVPGNNVQCFDRLDRGGQHRQVFGEIFVAPGSFSEVILTAALNKMQTIHATLDRRFV